MLFGILKRRLAGAGSSPPQLESRQRLLEEARTLVSQGLNSAAEIRLEALAERFPRDAEIRNEFGILKYAQGDFSGAETAFRGAIEIAPNYASALANLGLSLQARGLFEQAAAKFESALHIEPGNLAAGFNLAIACAALGDRRRAVALCNSMIAVDPDEASTHLILGECLLALEDYESGWREYEWRLRVPGYASYFRSYLEPLWDGSEHPGGRLLFWAEQGYGDTIQFLRLARLVIERMPSMLVILDVPKPLAKLARVSFGDCPNLTVVESGQPLPAFSCHRSIMSLAHLLQQTLNNNPVRGPYLRAEPQAAAQWARRVTEQAGSRLAVGLVWAGNSLEQLDAPGRTSDVRRSIGAELLAGLLTVPECVFFNLQVGARSGEMATLGCALADFTPELGDFADTAALVAGLDLVITVDTAVVHLAGALGKPVWMLSRFDCCWRWGERRTDVPWYPTLRAFYQPAPGVWEPVLGEVRRALVALVEQRAKSA